MCFFNYLKFSILTVCRLQHPVLSPWEQNGSLSTPGHHRGLSPERHDTRCLPRQGSATSGQRALGTAMLQSHPLPPKFRLPEEHSRCSQCPRVPLRATGECSRGAAASPASGDTLSRPCFCLCTCCSLCPGWHSGGSVPHKLLLFPQGSILESLPLWKFPLRGPPCATSSLSHLVPRAHSTVLGAEWALDKPLLHK